MIDTEIIFNNPVKRMPPQRQLHNIQHIAIGFTGKEYSFRLARIGFDVLRENFKVYPRDLPPFQGDMEKLQYWIDSIWEALYSPCWMRWVIKEDFVNHPNPKKKGRIPTREYQLLHGHHRIRMFDAMDANHMWVYMCTGHHHGSDLPQDIRILRKLNAKDPKRGTRMTNCVKCGNQVGVSSRKRNDFNIKRWYKCDKCGYYDDTYQPYPERI